MLLLSQLLDAELSPAEAAALRTHVASCADCGGRLARLDRATAAAHADLAAHGPEPSAPRPECLPPERIVAWAARILTGDALQVTASHLEGCDACLGEALAAARMTAQLEAGPTTAVPEALRARVASRWDTAPAGESLTTLVIRVARAGVALLERHLVAPVLDVEEVLRAAPAARTGDDPGAVRFRIRIAGAQIHATVVPEGDAVGLALTLLGADDVALAGQRVFLRRHGRSLYSARTDDTGVLRLPRIEPGVYEVSCPGIGTSVRLDLRP